MSPQVVDFPTLQGKSTTRAIVATATIASSCVVHGLEKRVPARRNALKNVCFHAAW